MARSECAVPVDPAPAGIGCRRLAGGALAFIGLTLAVFWYQFRRIPGGDAAPAWDHLRWPYLALIVLCLPIESLAAGFRTWVVSRSLQPALGLWPCLKAEWVNVAMNLLTPAHSGGGPGQVYMLGREGTKTGTALTISLIGFLGTMVGLLGMGAYALVAGGSAAGPLGPLFAASAGSLAGLGGAMVLAAAWPDGLRRGLGALSRALWRLAGRRYRLDAWRPPGAPPAAPPPDAVDRCTAKLLDLVYTYRDDVRRFLRVGKASLVWVCLLSFVFLFARILLAYLCLRFLGIETAGFGRVVALQAALIFVLFFAPTPGGAGLAEGASLAVMAAVVPVGFAPYYNLLWRASTAYVGALAGLCCLGRALLEDGSRLVPRGAPVRSCPGGLAGSRSREASG